MRISGATLIGVKTMASARPGILPGRTC